MTEQSLISRVKSLNTRSKTVGNTYVKLFAECVEHMFGESRDWTVLAALIGGAQSKDAVILRAMAGKVLQGWKLVKDEKQPYGLRFKKVEGQNQGFDETVLQSVKALAVEGKTLQGAEVKALVQKAKENVAKAGLSPEEKARKLKQHKTMLAKWAEEMGVTAEVLATMLTNKDEPNF